MMQVVLAQALSRAAEQSRPSLSARLSGWGRERWAAFQTKRRHRRTIRTLYGLDDRTLHDIGIDRSEITSYAARGGEDRHPSDRFRPRYIPPIY